jgi:hypothetical protein
MTTTAVSSSSTISTINVRDQPKLCHSRGERHDQARAGAYDVRSGLLAATGSGGVEWGKWRWRGTQAEGSALEVAWRHHLQCPERAPPLGAVAR